MGRETKKMVNLCIIMYVSQNYIKEQSRAAGRVRGRGNVNIKHNTNRYLHNYIEGVSESTS